MAKRASKLDFEQRVDAVYRLILDGWTQERLVPHIARMWIVKPRQARNYVYKARDRILEAAEQYKGTALAEHLTARRELRRESSDPMFKLTVLQDEAKLLGLYKERVEVAGKDGGAIVIRGIDPDGD